ncbi:hypothetical protein BDY19DRAFT_908759 [Irpex rosettiformis]|uniref:Uncharacterized protein n=1 Tax=Irpex rosettiformis TaxID=378272 RepID=A0ACB8TVD2_9APHY|nr:hypothetical protein BDY19DRAFT_908759 [Irpex rosettiformis]
MTSTTNAFLTQVPWHNDGDIVLVCDDTSFRVHLDVLAAQSDIFRHMAEMPRPRQEYCETYQGCPVIHLQDTPEDMKCFLEAIYELQFSPSTHVCTCADFATASSLLRLGTKYDARLVRQRAIDVFASVYPCTSDAWSRRDVIRQFPTFAGELHSTLALAISNDVYSLIPSILYTAAKLPPPDAVSELAKLPMSVDSGTEQDLFRRYMTGRQALHRAEAAAMMSYLSPSFTLPQCRTVGLKPYAGSEVCCAANPFKTRGESSDLCATCSKLIEKSIQEGTEEIWRRVPEMFGYADWETLKERDKLGQY